LQGASVYIIADPDTKDEANSPNFLDDEAAETISKWVKKGGVLLILANDSQNADLDHTNVLAKRFGMTFEKEIIHTELSEPGKPRNFNSCVSSNLPSHPLFRGVSKIFIKGVAPITVSSPAKSVLVENGKTLIAQSNFGKGFVVAVGDPWLYNEYIDNKILPTEIENLKAAGNLVKLLLKK
jgi:unsaturated rhamnogalacturonyl hydrolase